MSYYHGGCFIFDESNHHVCSGQFSIEKLKQCLSCENFETFYEKYKCNAKGGEACLLQIGINKFKKK